MAGNQVLARAAQRLTNSVRKGDVIARIGGDEFAILIDDISDELDAQHVSRNIKDSFAEPFSVGSNKFSLRVTIGIGIAPDHGSGAAALLGVADADMYRQKRTRGRTMTNRTG